jgi:hypothetical protein
MHDRTDHPLDLKHFRADLRRIAARDRWDIGLMGIGWMHLTYCLLYQSLYSPDTRRAGVFIALWISEVVMALVIMRRVAGRGWHRSTPLAGVIVRVWATFLILTFSVASLNGLTGFTVDWFKLVWCTLGSFGFATMAWLLSYWFLVPAFQMYFTALLMFRFPAVAYLIHGTSWFLTLNGLGVILLRRRLRSEQGNQASDGSKTSAPKVVPDSNWRYAVGSLGEVSK